MNHRTVIAIARYESLVHANRGKRQLRRARRAWQSTPWPQRDALRRELQAKVDELS